ncbi:MAG: hypothetical protein ACK5LS_12465 [Propioniciclava sp.]
MNVTDLLGVLDIPPQVPLQMTAARITVCYTTAAVDEGVPAETAEQLADTLQDLQTLLRAGFLSTGEASISIDQSRADRLVVVLAGAGLHRDLIVALLRLIHRQHQTPSGAFAELVRVLGDEEEARAVFGGMTFTEVIDRVQVRAEGTEDGAFDPLTPSAPTRPGLPAAGILEAIELVTPGCPAPEEHLEDAWLMLSTLEAFVPAGADLAHEPGEESFFSRGPDLVIHELSVEPSWLSAFLDVLGLPPSVQVTAPGPGY